MEQMEGQTMLIISDEGQPHIDKKVYKFAHNVWNALLSIANHLLAIGNYEDMEKHINGKFTLDPVVEYELLKNAPTWHFFEDKLMEGLKVNWIKDGEWCIEVRYVPNQMIHNIFPKQCYDQIRTLLSLDNIKKHKITKFVDILKQEKEKKYPSQKFILQF